MFSSRLFSSRTLGPHLPPRYLRVMLLILIMTVLAAVLILAAYAAGSFRPFEQSYDRIDTISRAVHEITVGRWRVERYTASQDDAHYPAAETAVLAIQDAIAQITPLGDDYAADFAADYAALSELEATGTVYLNTLRSYHRVAAASDAGDTVSLLYDQLQTTADTLDLQANALLTSTTLTSRQIVPTLTSQLVTLTVLLVIALVVVSVMTAVWAAAVSQRNIDGLHRIRDAAQQITVGRFDTQIAISPDDDHEITAVAAAFNQMAEMLNRTQQSETEATEQHRLEMLKVARKERTTAVHEERQRIARELHDSVKQQLFSITLSAGAGINLLENEPALARTHLEHIRQAGHSAQTEMTALLQELVSMPLQDKRLDDALFEYLDRLCETHDLRLLWRTDGTNTLTIEQEHALFRAVQEAVSNVIRHSGATVLRVSIRFGLLTHVIVEDNGIGFDPKAVPPTSNGLVMMQMRLNHVGGKCEIQSEAKTGTRLSIRLDLRKR